MSLSTPSQTVVGASIDRAACLSIRPMKTRTHDAGVMKEQEMVRTFTREDQETEWKTGGETRRQELMKTLMGDVR